MRALAIAIPVAALLGCGGESPPAQAPPPPSSAAPAPSAAPSASASDTPVAAAAPSASAAPSAPPPLAAVLMTDPAAIQKLFDTASTAPAAALKQNGASGADALARGLRDVAKTAAPGMQPDGPLATGSLKEKQHLQTQVTLQPGKCYAIVGFSSKVKDLDLHLLLAPGILSGEDTTDDNKPVIGRAPDAMCPSASTPVTYRLDILADAGDGDAAVQLYSKAK
ncbi:MAG TPA: hypothetical protein VKU41_05805 [Polyangiaceae bacterium]|nr:hypothetical protein [Polyangiaceae bacterium]